MKKYKILGVRKITEELELKDFKWEVKDLHYDTDTKTMRVGVYFWENHFKHERSFETKLNGGLKNYSLEDAINYVLAKSEFADSIEDDDVVTPVKTPKKKAK